jgi:hypothetical protein
VAARIKTSKMRREARARQGEALRKTGRLVTTRSLLMNFREANLILELANRPVCANIGGFAAFS